MGSSSGFYGPLPPFQGQLGLGLGQMDAARPGGFYDQQNALANSSQGQMLARYSPRMVPSRTCAYCGNHAIERRCESCGAPR
jgi:hypothetical protein